MRHLPSLQPKLENESMQPAVTASVGWLDACDKTGQICAKNGSGEHDCQYFSILSKPDPPTLICIIYFWLKKKKKKTSGSTAGP